jgi:hypothetical protein
MDPQVPEHPDITPRQTTMPPLPNNDFQSTELPPTPQFTEQPTPKPKRKTYWVIGLLTLGLLALLFLPVPQYNSENEVYCMALDCPTPGWILGPSLATRIANILFLATYTSKSEVEPLEPSSSSPTPTTTLIHPTSAEINNQAVDWNTYYNNTYSYNFDYPSKYYLEDSTSESQAYIHFVKPEGVGGSPGISISVHDDEGLDLNEWIDTYTQAETTRSGEIESPDSKIIIKGLTEPTKAVIGGKEGMSFKISVLGAGAVDYGAAVKNNDNIILITTYGSPEGYQETFDQILSSFEFTN